jgi:3',5'-cyclic AMP phosphodiesterase CpdA
MRTVLHLSDLHFGRVDEAILSPLVTFINATKPDLVAISGDFTQRARTIQFIAAQEFLDLIPFPKIVVPGNHDVPLRNLFLRFWHSLDSYRRYICDDLQPFYSDPEIAVAGVNTARALTWKDGRINKGQLEKLRADFDKVPDGRTKIVVTHHPFDLPAGAHGKVVGRSRLAIQTLAECGVDLLLSGHFHIADIGYTAKRYNIPGYSALVVSSGTSTSTRYRGGQTNSLNLIRINHLHIEIERHVWKRGDLGFEPTPSERFQRTGEGWVRE